MHAVVWTAGSQRFATRSSDVIEVIPLVDTRPLTFSAPWLRGLFNFRGKLVPMIDMPQLLELGQWEPAMRSRVIVVAANCGRETKPKELGLLVTTVLGSDEVQHPGDRQGEQLPPQEHSFLGPATLTNDGTIQWIETDKIPAPEL